jgi:membrane carboxypeptidase/penicillin-binding protein PbpC
MHQQWDIVYADEWKGDPKKGEFNEEFGMYVERPFHIVSAMNAHRYLDLRSNRNMVIKAYNKGSKTQIWYFDQRTLTIKTQLNNQSWDIKSSGRTVNMQVWSTNSQWF